MDMIRLNAELASQLSIIAKDETLMQKAVKALDNIINNSREEKSDEMEYITKDEILAGIDNGLKEMAERKRTGKKAMTLDELINEL